MDAKQKIEMAIAYSGVSKTIVAKRLGYSPQKLAQRIKTGKFTLEEWDILARAIGAESAELQIKFDDGKTI